jgi:hypothetical protein
MQYNNFIIFWFENFYFLIIYKLINDLSVYIYLNLFYLN